MQAALRYFLSLSLLLSAASTCNVLAGNLPGSAESVYVESADPMGDVQAALDRARSSGKRLLVVMGAQWCHDSRGLASTFNEPAVADLLAAHYETVFVDVGYFKDLRSITRRFGQPHYFATPTVMVIDAETEQQLNAADMHIWGSADQVPVSRYLEYFASYADKSSRPQSAQMPGEYAAEIARFEEQNAARLQQAYQQLVPGMQAEDRSGEASDDFLTQWREVRNYRTALQADIYALRQRAIESPEAPPALPTYAPFSWEGNEPPEPTHAQAGTSTEGDTLATIDKLITRDLNTDFDWQKSFPHWYEPMEPFRIAGEGAAAVYYVGTAGLGMYFIPTDEGHIVIDGGMPGQGELVAKNIRKLGYDVADVRILLNTHAHIDHSGGLAELVKLSGARLVASEGDRSALESGVTPGAESVAYFKAPPVAVDRIIQDGDEVTLGDVRLQAHITPGHTRGCTSWTTRLEHGGRPHDVLFFCSASVSVNRLAGRPQYEGIVQDYRQTFDRTRDWQPDMLLANHGEFFDLKARRERLAAGDSLAFVDKEAFSALHRQMEAAFEEALARQRAAYAGEAN